MSEELKKESFAQLFNESLKDSRPIKEGEVVKGLVMKVEKDHALIDVGFKSEGLIPLHEFIDGDGNPTIAVGDSIDVLIESYENDEGNIILSKEKADKAKLWDEVARACDKGELVEGKIVGKVKGGLSVDIGIKAFLPGSQIDLAPVRNMDALLGKVFQFKIIKFNKKRGNIVLSRRVLLERERQNMRGKTLQNLEEGKIMKGTIKNITDYGAFVDLGGIDGLLHITDMSWKRINHPSEVLALGSEIEVKILKYDRERERVSLGLKQITEDPWAGVDDRYPVDTRVKGKIVSLTDYGAFVELEGGVEGLIHISEMSWTKRVKHPSQLLKVGEDVESVVLTVDSANRKIGLGLKQVEPNPWALLEAKYPKGSKVTGLIKNITDFGIFVGIDEGIDGLVHISDLSWSQKIKDPNEAYKKGDSIEAVVLNIDAENERFSLGIKQLEEDPWDSHASKLSSGMVIEGEVIKITDFGLFVRLDGDIEGLVHVSEIAEERVEDPKQYAKVGDKIQVMVLNVDTHEKRISLSIKECKQASGGEPTENKPAKKSASRSKASAAASSGSTLGDLMPDELKRAKGPPPKKTKSSNSDNDDSEIIPNED